MSLSEVAVFLGVLNGLVLLVRPIGRLHSRIDRLEFVQQDQAQDIAKILGASGIKPTERQARPSPSRKWF